MPLSLAIRTALPRAALLALLAASPGGCARDTPTDRAPGADTTITLAPGGEALPFGGIFGLSFLEVTNDSRCPRDVLCIWAGNAVARLGLRAGMGPTVPYALNTTLDPRSVVYGIYRVSLVGLEPTPLSTAAIPPGDYRVTLRVERFGPD